MLFCAGIPSANGVPRQLPEGFLIESRQATMALGAANAVTLVNLHGDVRVRPSDLDEVEVHAVIQRFDADPLQPELRLAAGPGGPELSVAYVPRDADTASTDEVGAGGEPPDGGEWIRRVDVVVFVPAVDRLSIRTDAGLIESRGVWARLVTRSRSGEQRLAVRGAVEAFSETGAVTVRTIDSGWQASHIRTIAGDIAVSLSAEADVHIVATTAGVISGVAGEEGAHGTPPSPRRVTVVLGEGSGRLILSSASGDIAISTSGP